MKSTEHLSPIDRVFKRLSGTYAADWDRAIGQTPINDVKTVWAHELSGFLQSRAAMQSIAWALDNLPERCPNAVVFRNLCRSAPAVSVPQLPEPAADQARMTAELAKLAPLRTATNSVGPKDHKAWAKRILALHAEGFKIGLYALRCAREATGLVIEPAHA